MGKSVLVYRKMHVKSWVLSCVLLFTYWLWRVSIQFIALLRMVLWNPGWILSTAKILVLSSLPRLRLLDYILISLAKDILFCVVSASFCHLSLSAAVSLSLPPPQLMLTTCLRGTSQAHPLSVSNTPCSLSELKHGERDGVASFQMIRMCFVAMCDLQMNWYLLFNSMRQQLR